MGRGVRGGAGRAGSAAVGKFSDWAESASRDVVSSSSGSGKEEE
jgi:hypothetical protein